MGWFSIRQGQVFREGQSHKPLATALAAAQKEVCKQLKGFQIDISKCYKPGMNSQWSSLIKSKLTLLSRDTLSNLMRMPPETHKPDMANSLSGNLPHSRTEKMLVGRRIQTSLGE